MALSADTGHTSRTIADFISSQDQETMKLFLEVLLICDEMGLIGKEMFAIDGCKLPRTPPRNGAGPRRTCKRKKEKMEKAIKEIIVRHQERDRTETDQAIIEKEEQYIATLKAKVKKIKTWLSDNDDKPAAAGTAPGRATSPTTKAPRMKTSHGVVQGYNGVAMVDSKHQIVVHAEAPENQSGDPETMVEERGELQRDWEWKKRFQ